MNDKPAQALRPFKIPSTDWQRLYAYVGFYRTYPQMASAVPQGLLSFLSTNKEKLAEMAHAVAEKAEPKLAIRDPYIFEFLGLKASEAVKERSNAEGG